MDLFHTPPSELDTFIYLHLQPDERFLKQVAETIDKICTFLKGQCPYKISKAVKGGSLGKGTAVKNGSDADMVIFLNYFKCFEDQKKNRADILSNIRDLFLKYEKNIGHQIKMTPPRIIPSSSSPRSLNLQFKSTESSDFVEVDVLPAYDALGQLTGTRPNHQVYEALIKTGERGGEFSTCFTELQRDFIIIRPTKLKGLIRLVKYWYTEHVRRPYKPQLRVGEDLPPKYALELLIIYAWESAGKGEKFSTAEGFRTVLELIVQYKQLWIF
ncbi:2'-5'-oligoadenylate synthase 1-like [Rhinoraja longicauda]